MKSWPLCLIALKGYVCFPYQTEYTSGLPTSIATDLSRSRTWLILVGIPGQIQVCIVSGQWRSVKGSCMSCSSLVKHTEQALGAILEPGLDSCPPKKEKKTSLFDCLYRKVEEYVLGGLQVRLRLQVYHNCGMSFKKKSALWESKIKILTARFDQLPFSEEISIWFAVLLIFFSCTLNNYFQLFLADCFTLSCYQISDFREALFKCEKILNLSRIIKSDLKEKAAMCLSGGKKRKQKHFLLPDMTGTASQWCEKSRACFIMFKGRR